METKTCTKCKSTKPATSEFFARSHGKLKSWCKDCHNAYNREWVRRTPKAPRKEAWDRWYERNREKMRAWHRAYYHAHKEAARARHRRWMEANPDYYRRRKKDKAADAFQTAKRKARKMAQTPEDADMKLIAMFYKLAKQLSAGDTKYQVDHIVPLAKGGLHHQDNLQILTAKENARKWVKIDDSIMGLRLEQVELALACAPSQSE